MWEKFKKRWNITSNFQLIIILIVFAVTGSSTLYARKGIFHLLGITNETELWIRIVLYIVVILPVYNVLLLLVGFLFGQLKFALEFEKKMFGRIIKKRK